MTEENKPGNEDMPPATRPAAIDYLIADYGSYLGIEGIAFDEDQTVSLSVEGISLMIEYTGEDTGLMFQSIVGTVDSNLDLGLMLNLNVANHSSYVAGTGVVTIDPDSGAMVWRDRLNTENVTVEMFDEAVKRSAEHVRIWIDIANAITAPSEEGENVPQTEETEPMIRV